MAAGIGEASAILAVAQIGISLSNSLISYIGEVQDAPFRIQRISNEVATTSERLRDIGDLVARNQQTNIFSEEGINSAIRCSDECRKIIEDVKNVLRKGGWQRKSTSFDKEEIDTSLFSTLRWPFLKHSLEVPRAELQRIKIDLSLLFSSAMALGASTSHEKVKFSQDIPGLQKTRDWAARMADQARNRAKDRSIDFNSRGKLHNTYRMDDEPELFEDFAAYQERRIREEEDKKAQERALLLQAEQEAKRKQEEQAKREIEQKAIDCYKKEQEELQARTTESKETFRNELLRLGLQLDQIALIVDNSNLDFGGNGPDANAPVVRSTRGTTTGSTTTHIDTGFTESTNGETTPSRSNGRSRRRLPWRNLRKPNGHESPEPSLDFVLSDGSSATNDSIMIETWLLDVFSTWKIEIMPSAEWIEKKFRKHRKREDVWHCFAGLKPLWRDAILQFLKARNDGNSVGWSLYLIELPHQNSRMGLRGFRAHKYDDQLVQVVLFKRKDSFDASNDDQGGKLAGSGQLPDGPNTPRPINSYFNESLTNAQVHPQENESGKLSRPKVSFAQELDESINNQNTVSATDEPLRFNTEEEVQKAIKRLGEKKKKLGASDQERVDEINDMIVLLAAQLKVQHVLSPSQRRIVYGERGYNPTSATDMKSQPNTQFRNSEMNPGAPFPIVVANNASAVTDQTEEISIPRDYRNRPIGKNAAMSQVNRPELERYREHPYFNEHYPYTAYDSRQRPHIYEDTPIILDNELRTEMPVYAQQSNGLLVPGKELVVRRNSPSRFRSFERRRTRTFSRDRSRSRDREREVPRSEIYKRQPSSLEQEYHSRDPYPTRRPRIVRAETFPDRNEEIVIRRDERERERTMDFPYYEDDIVIRRDEREREGFNRTMRERERLQSERDEIYRRERERERPRYEREKEIYQGTYSSSSADEIIRYQDRPRHTRRRDYRSPSPGYIQHPDRRRSTFDDETWPGVESKAIVLRTGGSRPTPGYMQEHILNRSIRVRGEQDVLSSPEYPNAKRFRSPNDSRQSSYSERAFLPRRPSFEPGWATSSKPFNARQENSHRKPRNRDLERVKNRHQRSRRTISSSEDDDYLAMPNRAASKQQSKPSDEEVITQTLKRFTTFQGDQPPNATQSSSAEGSSRRPNAAQSRDSTIDPDTQISKGRGLGTMYEEPDTVTNENGPQSPSQAPFYPITNRFPPPPGPPRSPNSTSGFPRNPIADSRARGYDSDVSVPTYVPHDHYNSVDASDGWGQNSPAPKPEHSNNVETNPTRLSSDHVIPGLESSTRPAPNAVANGQVKDTKGSRITELSDGSSEDGRRRLRRKDRKATVEDFEPDLEAGVMAAARDRLH